MKNFNIAPLSALAAGNTLPARDARIGTLPGVPTGTSPGTSPGTPTDVPADAVADDVVARVEPALDNAPVGADPAEINAWLRLCHAPGVPPVAVRRLLAAFGPPEAIFRASRAELAGVLPSELVSRLLAPVSAALMAQVARTLDWAGRPGCAVVTLAQTAYPRALLSLGDAPPILYCRGDIHLPNRAGAVAAALVGSRRATPQGRDNARHFARVLGDAGVTVVSGLATGIDAAAHEGALETVGGTCAVVGTGADLVYPTRHQALAERIAERGLLMSAFPVGTPPRPDHFPRRNRLIAALARCTVVVEAATHSGSLITARLAGELGRDVLAVPGSIHALQSRGCHALIRDGATLASSPADVLEALGIVPPVDAACVTPTALPPDTAAVLEALGYDPVSVDTLCGRTGMAITAVLAHLSVLELDGRIARLPGGRFARSTAQGVG